MDKPAPTAAPKVQQDLRQNFENAIVQLHAENPKAVARQMPIAQRRRDVADPKTRALKVAATALSTLWGV